MATSDRLSIFRSRQYATPAANPPAGSNFLYPKADGLWYTKNSAGVETAVGSGGSATTDASLLTSGTLPDARLPTRLQPQTTAITDFNAATSSGWYVAGTGSAVNGPPTSGSYALLVVSGSGTTNTVQLAYEINSGTVAYMRTQAAGAVWGAWRAIHPEFLLARANHTGTQSADTLVSGSTNKAYTATEQTKLAGVATGATANSPDATLLARANHTGTQPASTITGLAAVATSGAKADVGLGNVVNPTLVRCVTTNNIPSLSGIPAASNTDSVTVVNGDRVLARNQFTGAQNGIWVVNSAGAWTRAIDADTSAEIAGIRVMPTEGARYAGMVFYTTFKATDTLGTTNMPWGSHQIETGPLNGYPDPLLGGVYFDNVNRVLGINPGGAWQYPKGIQDYSATAPTNPQTGEIWIDSGVTGANTTLGPFFKGIPGNPANAISGNVPIAFTPTEDSHNGWSIAGNYYQIQQAGLYRIVSQVKVDATNTFTSIGIYVNSTLKAWSPNMATTGFGGASIEDVLRLAVGDTVQIRPQSSDTLQNDSPAENTWFIVEWIRP